MEPLRAGFRRFAIGRTLAAFTVLVVLTELLGHRAYLARLAFKGKLPPEYVWLFHALLLLVALPLTRTVEKRRLLATVPIGAAIGYVLSFATFHALMAIAFDGIDRYIASQVRLGRQDAVQLALTAPLVLMGPISGALLALVTKGLATILGTTPSSPRVAEAQG